MNRYTAEVDDRFFGSFLGKTKQDAIQSAQKWIDRAGMKTEDLIFYEPGEHPSDRGDWTIWTSFSRWSRIFPDLKIGPETNGSEFTVSCDKYRIFCHRINMKTLGLDGVE